ncbi:hypothetical protein EOM86_13635 [Candidatus Nomurabacteria bacterium]|nr:hypothetical protein [Candidatus Nomurabacteria bacterium]
MKMKAQINTVLPAGTYWVKVAVSGSIASGPWLNPRAITSELSTGNAMQYVPSTGLWQALVDGVSLEQMGVPFIVRGSFVNEDLLGFNVYRDGIQINSDTIQSLYYNDENLDENREYCYSVQAVYDSCLSVHSSSACATTLFNPCVISSFPWTDNLDQYSGYTAGNVDLPPCYYRVNDATGNARKLEQKTPNAARNASWNSFPWQERISIRSSIRSMIFSLSLPPTARYFM